MGLVLAREAWEAEGAKAVSFQHSHEAHPVALYLGVRGPGSVSEVSFRFFLFGFPSLRTDPPAERRFSISPKRPSLESRVALASILVGAVECGVRLGLLSLAGADPKPVPVSSCPRCFASGGWVG